MKKKLISLLTAFSMTLMLFGSPNISAADNEHTHTHMVCVGSSCTDGSHENITWTGISDLSNLETDKHYYLTKNVNLSSQIEIGSNKDITLCLNGHTITAASSARIFRIESGGSLTLCDCSSGKTGTLTNGNGGAVNVYGGSFTMYGGTISGNTITSSNGGGVHVASSGTFEMNGGTISGNTAISGGGVCVYQGSTFTMNGGTISDNQASQNSGGVYNAGTFNMNGGTISGNTATTNGGGVYVDSNCTFTMGGGTISGNTATTNGGGVYVYGSGDNKGKFIMNGGTISGNTTESGGGVYVDSGTFEMTGGTIGGTGEDDKNTAESGGGVYLDGGTFNMNGGTISGNTTSTYGGGVYVIRNSIFTMSGGTISNNQAEKYGGGVYSNSIFNMYGGTISDNTSKDIAYGGGGVYVGNNGIFTMSGGTIEKNTSGNGGGVFLYSSGAKFKMTGGTISGNTAIQGGGVRVCDGTFTINGKVNISGNTKTGGNSTNNVNLYTNKTITIENGFDDTSTIGVNTTETPTCADFVDVTVFAEGATDDTKANDISGSFKADIDGQSIVNSTGNIVQLAGAHNTEKTEAKDPTCTEDGNSDYWYCSVCQKYFSDEKCTTKIAETETVINAKGHELKQVEAKDPTYTEAGNIEYWHCSVCKKNFNDENGTKELTTEEITIPATGYTGSCGDKGDNATWTYDETTNTITITGSGNMDNWTDENPAPWTEIADEIEKVVIGSGITSIGDNAFEDCTKLESVVIPDTVTNIGNNAFSGTGLTDVEIPASVTTIGDNAFKDCDNLKNVTFDGTTPPNNMGNGVFGGTTNLDKINVPEGSENAYKKVEALPNDKITDGTPDDNGSCGNNAKWTYDDESKTLTITGGGDMTDWNDSTETPWSDVAENIKNVVIEDGITSIGDNAFEGCTKLESVVIPDTVTDIGDNAIPDDVPQIKYSVTDDGKVIIENISGVTDGENVEIPNNIGGKPVVGVDENVQDKVTVKGHTDDDHTGGTPTCQQKAKCAICGEEYGELGKHALNPTEAKAPTCTEDGNDAYWTCSVCAKMFSDAGGTAEITEVTTYPKTGHTYSTDWDGDETYHWHSATCGHDSISDKEVHTWNEGVVKTEPTIEADGVRIRTCEICSATKTESIPRLEHMHTYSDEWTSDETNHWHNATCGHTTISGVAAHTEDSGKVTIPATAEAEGVKTYACTVCKRVMRTEPIPQLGEEHDHNFSTDWKHDETSHWHECDCGEKAEFSEHTNDGGVVTVEPTENSIGIMKYSCTVCGYVIRTEEIPALGSDIPDHSHSFGSEWEYDPTQHWHKCDTCGEKSDLEEHIKSGWIVETPAAANKEGVHIKVCTVCGIELDRKPIANKVQDTAGTKTKLVPDDNLLDKVLNADDKADINANGSSFDVILEVTAKPTDVEKDLISEALKPNGKLGMCVDLSLFKVKDGNIAAKIPVYETNSPIGITLTIPDSIYAPDRTYFVVRVHGDKAEKIESAYDGVNHTLTFYTDKFSIYAIAYTTSSVTPATPSTPSVPSTPSGGGTASVSPSVPVITPTVTGTATKTEDEVISDMPYVDDVSSAAGINETDDNSQLPLYMIVIIIAIAVVGFSSIIIVKRFTKKKH